MNDGDYTIDAIEREIKKQYRKFTLKFSKDSYPKAFVLGGQPGAGKTGLQKIMEAKCNGNLIVLNGDEFRELHPDYIALQEK